MGWAKITSQLSEQTLVVVPPRNNSRLWNEAQQEIGAGQQGMELARDARGAGWALAGGRCRIQVC